VLIEQITGFYQSQLWHLRRLPRAPDRRAARPLDLGLPVSAAHALAAAEDLLRQRVITPVRARGRVVLDQLQGEGGGVVFIPTLP
jgi:hypothetical protein